MLALLCTCFVSMFLFDFHPTMLFAMCVQELHRAEELRKRMQKCLRT